MAGGSLTEPQVSEPNAELQALIVRALRRSGDFAVGQVNGDLILLFLDFANTIVDEIRAHPYWPGTDLPYYISATDQRPIPDPIMVTGLMFHYAVQQESAKMGAYQALYTRTLNQLLWHALNGNTPIQLTVVDGGSTPTDHENVTVSDVNGLVSTAQ